MQNRPHPIASLVEKLQAFRLPCILCGGPPTLAGVFTPKDPATTSSPPGKLTVFGYNLCLSCAVDPGTPQRVEEKAMAYCALRRAGRVEPPL
jgi:hypothetical protein